MVHYQHLQTILMYVWRQKANKHRTRRTSKNSPASYGIPPFLMMGTVPTVAAVKGEAPIRHAHAAFAAACAVSKALQ